MKKVINFEIVDDSNYGTWKKIRFSNGYYGLMSTLTGFASEEEYKHVFYENGFIYVVDKEGWLFKRNAFSQQRDSLRVKFIGSLNNNVYIVGIRTGSAYYNEETFDIVNLNDLQKENYKLKYNQFINLAGLDLFVFKDKKGTEIAFNSNNEQVFDWQEQLIKPIVKENITIEILWDLDENGKINFKNQYVKVKLTTKEGVIEGFVHLSKINQLFKNKFILLTQGFIKHSGNYMPSSVEEIVRFVNIEEGHVSKEMLYKDSLVKGRRFVDGYITAKIFDHHFDDVDKLGVPTMVLNKLECDDFWKKDSATFIDTNGNIIQDENGNNLIFHHVFPFKNGYAGVMNCIDNVGLQYETFGQKIYQIAIIDKNGKIFDKKYAIKNMQYLNDIIQEIKGGFYAFEIDNGVPRFVGRDGCRKISLVDFDSIKKREVLQTEVQNNIAEDSSNVAFDYYEEDDLDNKFC